MSLKLAFGRDDQLKEPRRPEGRTLVRFYVGDTCYAFDVGAVEEVANPAALTTLPDMGAAVAGVTDHRGRVIPVVDLRAKYGVRETLGRHTKWVLMRSAYGLVGFVVDRVLDVVSASGTMSPPPRLGAVGSRAIVGVVNVDGLLVFILDEDAEASVIANVDLSAVGG
jgi:purine-binding chemotaxis protein CheW